MIVKPAFAARPLLMADAAATEAAGARLGAALAPGDAVALFGDLGMGKTTFARGVLAALGWTGDVASPTFPIVIPYEPPHVRVPVWHIDLYRLDDPEDIAELGLDDARRDHILLIEWPERMGDHLWADCLQLTLRQDDGGGRVLTAAGPSSWEKSWPLQ